MRPELAQDCLVNSHRHFQARHHRALALLSFRPSATLEFESGAQCLTIRNYFLFLPSFLYTFSLCGLIMLGVGGKGVEHLILFRGHQRARALGTRNDTTWNSAMLGEHFSRLQRGYIPPAFHLECPTPSVAG